MDNIYFCCLTLPTTSHIYSIIFRIKNSLVYQLTVVSKFSVIPTIFILVTLRSYMLFSLNHHNIAITSPQHAFSRSNKVSPQQGHIVVFMCIASLKVVCYNFPFCLFLYFLGVFSESTARALEFYGKGTPDNFDCHIF